MHLCSSSSTCSICILDHGSDLAQTEKRSHHLLKQAHIRDRSSILTARSARAWREAAYLHSPDKPRRRNPSKALRNLALLASERSIPLPDLDMHLACGLLRRPGIPVHVLYSLEAKSTKSGTLHSAMREDQWDTPFLTSQFGLCQSIFDGPIWCLGSVAPVSCIVLYTSQG